MQSFTVQFRLKTEAYQECILDTRFEIGRYIYNSLVSITQKRYREMIKTKQYRDLLSSITGVEKQDKSIWKQIEKIRKQYRLYEFAFHEDVKEIQHCFKENIDAFTAQKIASSLWKSYKSLFYGKGKKVHFKKYGQLDSLEGKSNTTGIQFKNGTITWKGLNIPVAIDYGNLYEYQALQCPISYSRLVRKAIKGKYKYYVQIVFKGNPPTKINPETGERKHPVGNGDVGLDIGTSTIAIASVSDVKIIELADKVQNIENQKRRLLRKMDRSRRTTNPNNYNEDGTIKKQGNKKVVWNQSNHYLKYQKQLRELFRKQADIRKYQHACLVNYILSLGDTIYVEEMNFAGLQKRATKTEKNEKGKFKKKKRFGKSLANRAPSMLLDMIDNKLKYHDSELIKINTAKARASQFNHFDETYKKKKLSQRWNDFQGERVQRDMYSAFLIMNINSDLETFNMDKCKERFENFKQLHDKEVNRLTGNKNLNSIAI